MNPVVIFFSVLLLFVLAHFYSYHVEDSVSDTFSNIKVGLKPFLSKYKVLCFGLILFSTSLSSYFYYIKGNELGISIGITILCFFILAILSVIILFIIVKETIDEDVLARHLNTFYSYGFLIASGFVLYMTFSDEHVFDYREFEKTKIAYMVSYEQFKSDELSKVNIDHRDFVKKHFYHNPIFTSHINISNFKEADKDAIVKLEFQKGLKNFIQLGKGFDSKFNRHLILQSTFLSPYINEDFEVFGKFNPDGQHNTAKFKL